MKTFTTALLLLMASTAHPQALPQHRLVFSAPTKLVTGEPLTDLAGYNVYCDQGVKPNTFVGQVGKAATEYLWTPPAAGTWQCALTAYRPSAPGTTGSLGISDLSNVLSFTITDTPQPGKPMAPVLIRIEKVS